MARAFYFGFCVSYRNICEMFEKSKLERIDPSKTMYFSLTHEYSSFPELGSKYP